MKSRWMFTLLTASLVAGMVGTSYAEVKVSGGELRLRGVMVDNGDSTDTTVTKHDGGFFEQRTRLNVDATADDAKVFLQVQDSRTWGSKVADDNGDGKIDANEQTGTTGSDEEALDLSQGYVEFGKLFSQPLSVRIGRQAMAYGEHRLIGSFEWSNNSRRFDAIKFTYKHDAADIDVWTAKVNDSGADYGNDDNFNGIYASLKIVPKNAVDVYLLQKMTNNAVVSDQNIYTIGGRVKGAVENLNVDYTAEIALQSGDFDTDSSQSASAFAVKAGYTLPDIMGLRVGVEYDAATGNKAGAANNPSTTNKDSEAFDNLYPTNHYLYGYTDDVNWSNIQAFSLNASLKPMDKVNLSVEYWNYKLAEETTVGAGDDLGTEINVKVNHEMSKNINCEAAYVMRDNGDAKTTASYGGYGTIPADESSTFGYFMINVKFM